MLPRNLSSHLFFSFVIPFYYDAGSGSGSGTVTGNITRTVTVTGTDSAQANKSYDSGSATILVHVRNNHTAFIPPYNYLLMIKMFLFFRRRWRRKHRRPVWRRPVPAVARRGSLQLRAAGRVLRAGLAHCGGAAAARGRGAGLRRGPSRGAARQDIQAQVLRPPVSGKSTSTFY